MKSFRLIAAGSLFAVLLASAIPAARADIIHFYNGDVLHCDVYRVTGEIIEYKSPDEQGSTKRLALTNRRDVVETSDGRKIFGEILYMDAFKVELKTDGGMVKVNRWKVSNIVVGSPTQMPVNDTMQTVQYQAPPHAPANAPAKPASIVSAPEPEPGIRPVSNTHPVVSFPEPTPAVDYPDSESVQNGTWHEHESDSLFPESDGFDRMP